MRFSAAGSIALLLVLVLCGALGAAAQDATSVLAPITPDNADDVTLLAVLDGHTSQIKSLEFNADGTLLASGSADGSLRVWDTATGESLGVLSVEGAGVYAASFSPDSRLLVAGYTDSAVRLWAVETGENLKTLEGHTDRITAVSFSPDGALIASTGADQTVRLWDVEAGENVETLVGHERLITSLAFSRDGRLLASADTNGIVYIWDVASGDKVYETDALMHEWITSILFNPSNESVTVSTFGGVYSLDFTTNAAVRFLNQGDTIAFSPIGGLVATTECIEQSSSGECKADSITLWDIAQQRNAITWEGDNDEVWALAFSPDGMLLAYGGNHAKVYLWGIPVGQTQYQPTIVPTSDTAAPASEGATAPSGQLVCAQDGGALSVEIGGETGEVTRSVNNSTSVSYADNGDSIQTLSIDETRTYRESGNAYHVEGTIVFRQSSSGLSVIQSYSFTVTGDALSEPQTCSG